MVNKLQILRKNIFGIFRIHFDSLISYLPSFATLKENKYKDTYVLKQH